LYIFAWHPGLEDLLPLSLHQPFSHFGFHSIANMSDVEKSGAPYDEKVSEPVAYSGENAEGEVYENVDFLHRRLGNRQIQLIAIGGSIGTVWQLGAPCPEICDR
jgi:hypothetical protein